MRGKNDRGSARGFTLVEVLVAIAILGFLATMAVTSYITLSEKYKVETETKQIYVDLMDARGRAMQRSRFYHVAFASSGYSTVEDGFPAPDGDGNPSNGTNMPVTSVTLKHAITTVRTVGGAAVGPMNNVTFNRNGIPDVTGYLRLASPTNVNPDYNCITILETRTKMGQWNGTACIER